MTVTRQDIIVTARTYIDTPFHHQGRLKGVGIDCIGLLFGIAQDLELPYQDVVGYTPRADGHSLTQGMDRQLIRITHGQMGSIVLFWIRNPKKPTHVGIITPHTIIHTEGTEGVKRVVENTFDSRWRKRVTQYYDYPGVTS